MALDKHLPDPVSEAPPAVDSRTDPAYTLSLHDALPISDRKSVV